MNDMRFEWDERKEKGSITKHGVSFGEARSVFYDENAVEFFDPDHSADEDRFIMLGISYKLRVIVVCHCFRESDAVVRIISEGRPMEMTKKSIGAINDERSL
jgi:uncharacterized protein